MAKIIRLAEYDRASETGGSELAREPRDTERAMALWHQKAAEFGGPPPATAFDVSAIIRGDWSYRFLICGDAAESCSFIIYGSKFARLLELAERPVFGVSIIRQLPGGYLSLFTAGCREAIAQAAPIPMRGAVVRFGQIEVYRAAFMPFAMRPRSLTQLIFGTFNRRIGPRANASDAVLKT